VTDQFDELVFETDTLIEIPVRIGTRKFVLREADGETGVAYVNRQMNSMKVKDGKVSGLGNVAELGPFLLSRCLWEVIDGGEQLVSEQEIKTWKHTVVTKLIERCKKISDIDQRDEEDAVELAKNAQAGSPDGSD